TEEFVFLIGQCIHEHTRPPAVFVIAKIYTHAGEYMSHLVVSYPRSQGDFFKCPVMLVTEQLLGHRVVGYKNIGPAITVKIVDGDTESFAGKSCDPTALGNICESSITVVVKNKMGNRTELVGMAIGAIAGLVLSAVNVGSVVPLDIAADDQIEPAIAIVIDETSTRASATATHTSFRGDIGEGPIAIVVIENIAAEIGHQQIN